MKPKGYTLLHDAPISIRRTFDSDRRETAPPACNIAGAAVAAIERPRQYSRANCSLKRCTLAGFSPIVGDSRSDLGVRRLHHRSVGSVGNLPQYARLRLMAIIVAIAGRFQFASARGPQVDYGARSPSLPPDYRLPGHAPCAACDLHDPPAHSAAPAPPWDWLTDAAFCWRAAKLVAPAVDDHVEGSRRRDGTTLCWWVRGCMLVVFANRLGPPSTGDGDCRFPACRG